MAEMTEQTKFLLKKLKERLHHEESLTRVAVRTVGVCAEDAQLEETRAMELESIQKKLEPPGNPSPIMDSLAAEAREKAEAAWRAARIAEAELKMKKVGIKKLGDIIWAIARDGNCDCLTEETEDEVNPYYEEEKHGKRY